MSLRAVPNELILRIAQGLESEGDINSLAQSCRRCYNILHLFLYRFLAQHKHKREAALIWAAKHGRDRTARLILQTHDVGNGDTKKFDLNCTDSQYGLSSLAWAAARDHEAVVKLLLETEGVNPDPKNRFQRTPLSYAAENCHAGVVKLLFTMGRGRIDANATDYYYYRTPLVWAGSPRSTNVFEEDTEKNFNQPLSMDKSELYPWSAGSSYASILDLCIQYGANLTVGKSNGYDSPLGWAAACGYKLLVEMLLDKTALDLSESGSHPSPLNRAAKSGHTAVVALLLERGAEVEDSIFSGVH